MSHVRRIELWENELREHLLPLLRGHVFHVTGTEAYRGIEAGGAILPVPPASSAVTWRCEAYFRGIGCVSLCDLRSIDDDQMELALSAFYFLDPRHGNPDPVFLMLKPSAFPRIITYSEAITNGASTSGKMIVPHIEAGYPGELPLSLIADTLFVDVHRPPPDAHLQALMRYSGSC